MQKWLKLLYIHVNGFFFCSAIWKKKEEKKKKKINSFIQAYVCPCHMIFLKNFCHLDTQIKNIKLRVKLKTVYSISWYKLKCFDNALDYRRWYFKTFKATDWVLYTYRVYHVWCNFYPGYMCRTTVIFGTVKDGSLQIHSLALNQ